MQFIVWCSCAKHFALTVPLSTQVYKWVPANLMLRVTLQWTSIASRAHRSTPSHFMIHDTQMGNKCQPDGPLGCMQTCQCVWLFIELSSVIGTWTVWPPSHQLLFTQKTLMKPVGSQELSSLEFSRQRMNHLFLCADKWTEIYVNVAFKAVLVNTMLPLAL